MALSDLTVRQARTTGKRYTISDNDCLGLLVSAAGGKSWLFRHYWLGKQKRMSLGGYPALSLREARALLARGIDPQVERDRRRHAAKLAGEHTFKNAFDAWVEHRRKELKEGRQSTRSQILRIFNKDVLPTLGRMSIYDIRRPQLLGVLAAIEKRKAFTTAEKVRTWFNQLFRYALVIAEGLEVNPAADLDVVAEPKPPVAHNTYLHLPEMPEFLQRLRLYNPRGWQTQLGVRLLFLTGVRTGELRLAEPQQFDLDRGLWIIPLQVVKQLQDEMRKAGKRPQDVPPYIVPLSLQAIEIVRYLEVMRPAQKYLLSHRSELKKRISENTLNKAVQLMGYEGRLTGHGIRGTISAALNEIGYPKIWVDAQLSHSDPNKVSSAYNHAKYVEPRRRMMQDWADRLDLLEQGQVEAASAHLTIRIDGVPSDPQRYRDRLVQRFPEEAAAIDRYFAAVRRALAWSKLGFMRAMMPQPFAPLIRLAERLSGGRATQPTARVLEGLVQSPELRALLVTQWMDYGVPPAHSAFAIHAQIVSHYLNGAWYPQGGASRIARTFEAGIERAGGAVRVAQQVEQILVEDGRVVGVRVTDHRGASPCERVYHAPVVISNAGAPLTYERLLPTDGPIGLLTAPQRALMATLQKGEHARLSVVTLYLRLRASAATLGVQGENHWINADFDHDDVQAQTQGLMRGRPRRLYLSFPSLKSGEEHVPTAEIMGFVDSAAFDAWRDTTKGSRGADYLALKERISDGILTLADTAVPGLRGLVAYSELSTPLTVEHYSMHPYGRIFGLPATPERQRSGLLGPCTPVPGLFLAGADAGCLGIVGALMGGVGAACQVLGPRGYQQIRSALRHAQQPVATAPAVAGAEALPPGKAHAVLTARQKVTGNIFRLEFELDRPFDDYAAGQFARIRVAEFDWRDYSIAALDGRRITFLISTRTGGLGSRFAAEAALGTRTVIEGPMGRYTLSDASRRAVFIATGTGLAPFLPMFGQLARAGTLAQAALYFGCRTLADDITTQAAALPGNVVLCLSQDNGEIRTNGPQDALSPRTVQGRVTDALAECDIDPAGTDFYLCGSGAMVADTAALLARRGARHVFTESY